MEYDILDSLDDLGYQGPLSDDGLLEKVLDGGPESVQFTQLVEWLTKELKRFTSLEDCVTAINGPDEAETFLMELSGFLRELGCPYPEITEGPLSQRLDSKKKRLHLLDYLLTELQAVRIITVNKPNQTPKYVEVETSDESETARHLKAMLMSLNFPKPPDGVTTFQLFSKVENKIQDLISKIQAAYLNKPLLKARLSDKQWEAVNYMNTAMRQEYGCRREMLLKRLDLTIQSFKWSDRATKQEDKVTAVYQPIRRMLSPKVETDIAHLLAAREDLLHIQKTSSGKAREKTKTPLNRVLIGKVPDRGGRAYEHEIPPPEMPGFQQRQNAQPQRQHDGGRGGRGSRGRGSDRGGERPHSGRGHNQYQSNWGQNTQAYGQQQGGSSNPASGFYGSGGGGYQEQRGGFQQGGYQEQRGGYQEQRGGYQEQRGGYQQSGGDGHNVGSGRRGGRGDRGGGRGTGGRDR